MWGIVLCVFGKRHLQSCPSSGEMSTKVSSRRGKTHTCTATLSVQFLLRTGQHCQLHAQKQSMTQVMLRIMQQMTPRNRSDPFALPRLVTVSNLKISTGNTSTHSVITVQ